MKEYLKRLNKLLEKAQFIKTIDESNILWYGKFWIYNDKYYISNVIGGVAETSKLTYINI